MLVDLIELYSRGSKIPRDAWRDQPRYTGELRVTPYFSWGRRDYAPASAALHPVGHVPDLEKVRLTFLWGRNIVLFGEQNIRGAVNSQMWWCRIRPGSPSQ